MRTIEIVVAPDGQSRLETKGFSGRECQEASRLLERALGKQTSEQLTGEYYRADTRQTNHMNEET